MLKKNFDDQELIEKLLKHLENYNFTNEETESKIKKNILLTQEYKKFNAKSNLVDINDMYINKSFILEQYKKMKKNKR